MNDKQPMSAGKIVGITCGSLFALVVLLPALAMAVSFGGGDNSTLVILVVAGLVVLGIVSSRKKRKSVELPATSYQSAPAAQVQSQPIQTSGDYLTTVCQHSFSAADLAGKATVTCPCGYNFKTKDLKDYQAVSATYLQAEQDLMIVRQRLIAATNTSGRSTATSSAQVPAAKPAKPLVRKPKATVSLQQWLIMGASAIIVIAGAAFVSTNLNKMTSLEFLGVTFGIGVVTGVLALWGRKFSVMLANFMATFSSAMLMFSILIVGDIFNPFTWDTAPAWWWTIDLLIVSAVSFVLARFKANFGWKIVSLAALVAAGFFYSVGELAPRFEIGFGSGNFTSAAAVVFAVAVAFASTLVAKMKFKVEKGNPDAEYEKDLAKREDDALEKFTFFSFIAFALIAVAYPIITLSGYVNNPDPVAATAFAAASALAIVTQSRWASALSSSKEVLARFDSGLHIFAFTVIALALNAWLIFIDPKNFWIGLIGSTILLFAIVAAGFYVKRLAKYPSAIQAAHIAIGASWLLGYLGEGQEIFEFIAAIGIFFIAFGLSLVYQSWLGSPRKTIVASTIFHFLGLGLLFVSVNGGIGIVFSSIESRVVFNPISIEYALITLALILLAVAYAPLTAAIGKKLGEEFAMPKQNLIFGLTTALAFLLSLPRGFDVTLMNYLFVVAVLGGSAIATGLSSVSAATRSSILTSLLMRYSYAFQGVLLFGVVLSSRFETDLMAVGLILMALAALNYSMAWYGKIKPSVWLAYGYSIAGLLVFATDLRQELPIAAHLGLVIVAGLALNFVLRLVDKRVSEKYTTYFSLISVYGLSIASFVMNWNQWRYPVNSDQIWLGLVILCLVAILAAGSAELKRFNSEKLGIAVRVAGLAYLLLAFVTVASLEMSPEFTSAVGEDNLVGYRRIAVAAIFAVIVFRQLGISSKAKSVTTNGWFALGYLAPVTIALITSDLLYKSVDLGDFNLELYTIPLALAIALPTLFNSALPVGAKRLIGMDVPLLFPVAASALYSLSQNINEPTAVYRLVASTAILAVYSWFRFSKGTSLLWAILEYVGVVGLGLSLAQLVEVLAPELMDGPELFGLGLAAAIFVGNKNLSKVIEFKSTIFTNGLPLAALLVPSVVHTYSTLDVAFEQLGTAQIIRILALLVISLVALILGIRAGNLGSALAGGATLSLLVIPITWTSAGASANEDVTIGVRALALSLFLFLFLGGLRSINKIPDSSYVYLGIPSAVALGPALYLSLQSIGESTLTTVDWWRFGIIVAASITLLVVGALRSLGGLFFPGLVGILVGVLPYGFQPISRESWFLWVVLLIIAAVMVWIAVRLEQLRKLGKSSASWIKTLR
jgi:hypothetical protein